MEDNDKLKFLAECRSTGIEYRDKFTPTFDEVEKQIRCVPPDSWGQKEDWQTKIYIPLQAKNSEIVKSYLKKMIFGKKRSFDITGVEKEDHDDAFQLTNLIDVLLQSGNFEMQNDYVLQEGIDLGTGFIKMSMKPDGMGLDFMWRSVYNVVFDPECGHDFEKARFVIDLYRRDLRYVLENAKTDKSKYNKKIVEQFLKDAEDEASAMQSVENNKEPLMTIRSIDGTQDLTIPRKYATLDVDEYWIKMPNEDGGYDDKRLVMLNGKYILSEDDNIFGFIPVQWCRTKVRKYDSYGRGYFENTRGLQELMNSCVNLGFDSQKISSMDIIVIDDTKVKDPLSIKYKPLAVWKMKDINAVQIRRSGASAITDILKGLTLIDQIHQDATGATRQAQGSPNLSGSGTQTDTLGEYELKLQMIDQRFLDQGRFIENDYFLPIIKKIYKIIVNPKLFNQAKVNRLLGVKEIDNVEIGADGVTKVVGTQKVSKLELKKIQDKGEMSYDFKIVGTTQFSNRLEILAKIKEALQAALSNPTLTALTKIDKLWEKLWQVSEIDDYQDLIRKPEEARELVGMPSQPGMMPPPGTMGQIPPQMGQQPPISPAMGVR